MKRFLVMIFVMVLILCTACAKDGRDSVVPETNESSSVTDANSEVVAQPSNGSTGVTDANSEVVDQPSNDNSISFYETDGWHVEGPATKTLIAPNGNTYTVDSWLYMGSILSTTKTRCLLGVNEDIWLCDQNTGLTNLTEGHLVVDYTIAYNTLYWYNLEREVWAVNWNRSNEPYLFCEDAIGVSPYTDEGQGAVVTPDRANCDWTKLPIYSLYGE